MKYMPSELHEELLINTIDCLTENGLRVIRLDCRSIPDAFVIMDNKVLAIEIETDGSPKYSRTSEFDEIITITPQVDNEGVRTKAYLMAIRLRKEGKTYHQIKDYLHDVGVHVGVSTLHDWFRGKSLPSEIYIGLDKRGENRKLEGEVLSSTPTPTCPECGYEIVRIVYKDDMGFEIDFYDCTWCGHVWKPKFNGRECDEAGETCYGCLVDCTYAKPLRVDIDE